MGQEEAEDGLHPLPYLLLRDLLVSKELVNFPVVLEAPRKEGDDEAHSPTSSLQTHTATNSVRHRTNNSTVRAGHRHSCASEAQDILSMGPEHRSQILCGQLVLLLHSI